LFGSLRQADVAGGAEDQLEIAGGKTGWGGAVASNL
jgi:hypothetical protein